MRYLSGIMESQKLLINSSTHQSWWACAQKRRNFVVKPTALMFNLLKAAENQNLNCVCLNVAEDCPKAGTW